MVDPSAEKCIRQLHKLARQRVAKHSGINEMLARRVYARTACT